MAGSVLQQIISVSDAFQDAFTSSNNVIAHMEWERQLQGVLSLSKDQMRFMLALFASVPVGAGIQIFKNPTMRHLYALFTGVLLTYYPFGAGVFHALPPALLTYFGMIMSPKRAGYLAWLANFPYLIYLHVVNASGHNWMKGNMDFTGCEMVLVLKLISMAMCYQDYHTKKKEQMNEYQQRHALAKAPTFLEFLSFTFSLGNLLAGPYFEFKDYKEFMDGTEDWDPKAIKAKGRPGIVLPTLRCLAETFFFMALYLNLLPTFNIGAFKTTWYNHGSYIVKLAVIFITSAVNQFKYCFAWKLSESSLTLAGLNFNGWDPKTGKPEWGRVRNVRWFRLITCDSARTVPQFWNIGTGIFLRRYVYERLVMPGKKPGFPQLFATQITSAIWHGLYPGYLLFFAGSAVWIFFSQLLYKAEQKFAPALSKSLPVRVVKIAWTNFVLNYMATAFMILDLHNSLDLYKSIYYVPHVIMLVGCFTLPLVVGGKGKSGKAKGSKDKEL